MVAYTITALRPDSFGGAAPVMPAALAAPAVAIYPATDHQRATICVLGVARGGTSLIAGLLIKLGIFMGDQVDPANGEDAAFLTHGGDRQLFSNRANATRRQVYLQHTKAVVATRNWRHAVWGWKDPLASFYVNDIADQLQSPVFIVVSRDVAAVAQRELMQDIPAGMPAGMPTGINVAPHYCMNACGQYLDIFDLVTRRRRPTLLVSYERCLRAPLECAESLAAFVGREATPEYLNWAAGYIQADRGTGELEPQPDTGFRMATLGSSDAARLCITESITLRRGAQRPPHDETATNPHQAGANPSGTDLYAAAARELNAGKLDPAIAGATELLAYCGQDTPALRDGVIGVIAAAQIGEPESAVLPDIACGALYMIGMAHLLKTDAQRALLHLTAAEASMRVRLSRRALDCDVSRDNYWSSQFHIGMAASAIGRSDIVRDVRALFRRALAGQSTNLDHLGCVSLDHFARRSERELSE